MYVTIRFSGRLYNAIGVTYMIEDTIFMDPAKGDIALKGDALYNHPDFIKLYEKYKSISFPEVVQMRAYL